MNPYIYNPPNTLDFQQNMVHPNQVNNLDPSIPPQVYSIDNPEVTYPQTNQPNYMNPGIFEYIVYLNFKELNHFTNYNMMMQDQMNANMMQPMNTNLMGLSMEQMNE